MGIAFTNHCSVKLVYYTPIGLPGYVASASHGGAIQSHKTEEAVQLTSKLAKWCHLEPLEVSLFVFSLEIPLFVASQLNRHRIGCSRTQQSLRYCKIDEARFYVDDVIEDAIDRQYLEALESVVKKCAESEGREERESLNRMLPNNIMIKYRCAFNARSFAHLCEMRISKHAQTVTRQVVEEMLEQVMQTEWREVFEELLTIEKG